MQDLVKIILTTIAKSVLVRSFWSMLENHQLLTNLYVGLIRETFPEYYRERDLDSMVDTFSLDLEDSQKNLGVVSVFITCLYHFSTTCIFAIRLHLRVVWSQLWNVHSKYYTKVIKMGPLYDSVEISDYAVKICLLNGKHQKIVHRIVMLAFMLGYFVTGAVLLRLKFNDIISSLGAVGISFLLLLVTYKLLVESLSRGLTIEELHENLLLSPHFENYSRIQVERKQGSIVFKCQKHSYLTVVGKSLQSQNDWVDIKFSALDRKHLNETGYFDGKVLVSRRGMQTLHLLSICVKKEG